MRRTLFLLIPLTLVSTACGGDTAAGHGAHGDNSDADAAARNVSVIAEDFSFDPPRIDAAVGEDLAIELTAVDAEHDFVIDALDAHVGADVGQSATGGFNTGDQPGTYTFYCSVPGHREAGMEGELVVE